MIAYLLIALFLIAACAAGISLIDSAIRGRNAWKAIRREMMQMRAANTAPANVVVLRPAPMASRSPVTRRPAQQMPRAVAA